jgi:hypothetical protein
MATGVVSWSQTAATNATADSAVNWAEGMAPSAVNDSARAQMASVAKYRDDQAGSLVTGGSSTAYTLTTNQVFATLAAMSGQSVRVKFHATSGAAPTLNVDTLGAKAVVTVTGTAVATGALVANNIYELVYANGSNEWILIAGTTIAAQFDSGTLMLFQQTAAPTGWTKQATHNDKALRVVSGTASSGGSTVFSSIFAPRTISQANLPNVALSSSGLSLSVGGVAAIAVGTGASAAYIGTAGSQLYATSVFGTIVINGTVSLGGSGTGMDFAVQYVDLIIASKN